MAARTKSRRTRNADSRMFVLALGLLVGFIIGFVMLLSRLPVDGSLNGLGSVGRDTLSLNKTNFDYYAHLPKQTVAQKILSAKVPDTKPVVVQSAAPRPAVVDTTLTNRTSSAAVVPVSAARSNDAVDAQVSPAGQASYFLQAGNYRRADQAERARAAVMMLGLDAFIVVRQDSSGSFGHRVRIGPYFDQTNLLDARDRLRSDGIPYQMIRVKN